MSQLLYGETIRTAWNLLIYLSLLLPTTYFLSIWLWYGRTPDAVYNFGSFDSLSEKIPIAIIVSLFYSILAAISIGANLFRIEISGNYYMKGVARFCLWFTITSIISLTIACIVVYFGDPSSLDRYGRLVTQDGLTVREQVIVHESQAIEIDTSNHGQYQNATESLSKIIHKYVVKFEQNYKYGKVCGSWNGTNFQTIFCTAYRKDHKTWVSAYK